MKKLLLLTGLVVNAVVAIESAQDRFAEFLTEQDNLIQKAIRSGKKGIMLESHSEGYISCDKINQLSAKEYRSLKQKALAVVTKGTTDGEVLVSVLLYNNLVQCVEPSKKILSWQYYLKRARERRQEVEGLIAETKKAVSDKAE